MSTFSDSIGERRSVCIGEKIMSRSRVTFSVKGQVVNILHLQTTWSLSKLFSSAIVVGKQPPLRYK